MYSLLLLLCYCIIQYTSAHLLQNRNINTPNFSLARNTISSTTRNQPISGGLATNLLNQHNNLLQLNSNIVKKGANLGYNNVALASNPNLVEASVANINLANGYNINTGTFTQPKNPILAEAFARQGCGVNILADALQVTGTVNVNGNYPIAANVAISGRLPNDGTATVVW
nr:uncharacterized protein LOC128681619 isoform X1 [Plodia interpunctella]